MSSGYSKRHKIMKKRGNFGYSVPEAGAMIGLGRNASYEAAKRGEIPTMEFGSLKIVPRILWHRKLGIEAAEGEI